MGIDSRWSAMQSHSFDEPGKGENESGIEAGGQLKEPEYGYDLDNVSARKEVYSIVNSPEKVIDEVNHLDKQYYHDETMKQLLMDANFTGFLLSTVVKEMKDVSIEEFCERMGACEKNNFKLKGEPTEHGTANTKAIRLDFILEYAEDSDKKYRINIEPQTTQHTLNESNEDSYS